MEQVKRLRIFAGPNGSGKSTIFGLVDKIVRCPNFVNADLIEQALSSKGKLSFADYSILVDEAVFLQAFRSSGLFVKARDAEKLTGSIKVADNILTVEPQFVDSYFSAFVAEFLRLGMLNVVDKFTVETVMSDPAKLDYIRLAKQMGYRIYLYFIATKDVNINIKRVGQRTEEGGHGVPVEKIIKRYDRSLDNMYSAMQLSDRAYFFDNSESEYIWLAEYNGKSQTIYLKVDTVPGWFEKYILKKM